MKWQEIRQMGLKQDPGEKHPCSMNCLYAMVIFPLFSSKFHMELQSHHLFGKCVGEKTNLYAGLYRNQLLIKLFLLIFTTFFHLYSSYWKMTLNLNSAFLFHLGAFFFFFKWHGAYWFVNLISCVKAKFMFNSLPCLHQGLRIRPVYNFDGMRPL